MRSLPVCDISITLSDDDRDENMVTVPKGVNVNNQI